MSLTLLLSCSLTLSYCSDRWRGGRGPADQPGGGAARRPEGRPSPAWVLLGAPGGGHGVQLHGGAPGGRGHGLQAEAKPLPRPGLSLRPVSSLQVLLYLGHPSLHHLGHERGLQREEDGVQTADLPGRGLPAVCHLPHQHSRNVFNIRLWLI